VTYKYCSPEKINYDDLEAELLSSSLFSTPATSADSFADQLESVVIATLLKSEPLKTITRKVGGKPINRFLSQNAKEAKKMRRRLESCWKCTGEESDRLAYRRQCRYANSLINELRRSTMQNVFHISIQDTKNAGQPSTIFSTLVSTMLYLNLKGNCGVQKYRLFFKKN